jgi:hypothetical protein
MFIPSIIDLIGYNIYITKENMCKNKKYCIFRTYINTKCAILFYKMDNNIPNKQTKYSNLKNYSETLSFNRLSDKDYKTASELTAGGDNSLIEQDINGSFHQPW